MRKYARAEIHTSVTPHQRQQHDHHHPHAHKYITAPFSRPLALLLSLRLRADVLRTLHVCRFSHADVRARAHVTITIYGEMDVEVSSGEGASRVQPHVTFATVVALRGSCRT